MIRPVFYSIDIAPDLVRQDFAGSVRVQLQAEEAVQTVDLNALDLAVRRCTCNFGGAMVSCPFRVHSDGELLQIELPEPMEGAIELQIDYMGQIQHSMAGFYRSQYTKDGSTRPIAVTQFQESDARRAFPCMDHPAYKAAFSLSMTVDEELEAISNMPASAQNRTAGGKKRICFETSPKMATYLLFFGVGDFQLCRGETDPRVRVAWLPGMAEQTGYGLGFAQKALAFCEESFGISYPLPKMDLIAVPDFAFGAMENWGAITFRENLLLYDPEVTSADAEERICEVIAHEIVHQWFGNLVTPADWKYLWLNESFATYFGFAALAHYHPDWQIWEQFLAGETASAMARDALTEAPAIEIRGGSHVVINSSTAPIIYSKGASVLRQIHGYLGDADFKKGLELYLRRHAYGCTASSDMWTALEEASGTPVSRMMQAWVETPGHPLVVARRENDRLVLHQQRFTFLPADAAGADPLWPIPLLIRVYHADGSSQQITDMMTEREMAIDIGPDAACYMINDGRSGFFRTAYDDPANFEALCLRLRQKGLDELERWGLEGDVFALVKARQYSVEQYLQFLENYRDEEHPLVLQAVLEHLHELFLVLCGPEQQKSADMARALVRGVVDRLGLTPGRDEPHGRLRLRRQAVSLAALLDMEAVLDAASEQFAMLMEGGSLHPDIRQPIMQAGARSRGQEAFQWLARQCAAAASEQERISMLSALGCLREPEQIADALEHTLKNTPDRNKFIPIAHMARNPSAVPMLWDWYTRHYDELAGVHPLIHERIAGAIIPVCGLDRGDEIRSFFAEAAGRTAGKNGGKAGPAEAVVQMALEKLDINQNLRSAYAE